MVPYHISFKWIMDNYGENTLIKLDFRFLNYVLIVLPPTLILTIILIISYHLIIQSKLSELQLLLAVITHNKFDDLQTNNFDISNCFISFNYYILFNGGEMWYIDVLCYIHVINYRYCMGAITSSTCCSVLFWLCVLLLC